MQYNIECNQRFLNAPDRRMNCVSMSIPLGVPNNSGSESVTSKLYRIDRASSSRSQSWMTCAQVWTTAPQGHEGSSDGTKRR